MTTEGAVEVDIMCGEEVRLREFFFAEVSSVLKVAVLFLGLGHRGKGRRREKNVYNDMRNENDEWRSMNVILLKKSIKVTCL